MKHYDLIVAGGGLTGVSAAVREGLSVLLVEKAARSAGRCLSATHEAQAAVRVVPICACMGDAVGTAIAVAKRTGKNTHTLSVQTVREKLIAHGACL